MIRTAIALAAVFAAGISASAALTDRWHAFTSESARRLAVLGAAPEAVAGIALQSDATTTVTLADLRGRALVAHFMYTSCTSVCGALGAALAEVQHELRSDIATGAVRLISLSLGPERDTPDRLRAYLARHRAEPGWMAARALSAVDQQRLLRAFGVFSRRDAYGEIQHNAALLVIDPAGRIVAIHDLADWALAARDARAAARTSGA